MTIPQTGTIALMFYTSNCAACKTLWPRLEAAALTAGAKARKIDAQEHPALAKRYNVLGVPTTVLLRDGEWFDCATGVMSEARLARWFERR